MAKPGRGYGKNMDAGVIDQERVFVRAVSGASVLHDPQAARDDLFLDAVVEQDDAVGDVFLDAEAGKLTLAAFGGDDGGDALVLEPAEQAPEFSAKDGGIRQS